jgi:hypothetical protein
LSKALISLPLEIGGKRDEIRTINEAAVCLRYAKFRKDLKMASWISLFGSLCIFILFEVLIGAALPQQKRGLGNDIL